MSTIRPGTAILLAGLALAGCSGGGGLFGGPKHDAPTQVVDPNLYPSNYRKQIASMLALLLKERSEFRGALIAQPELKPVELSATPHYVVCVQLNLHNQSRTKVAIFLGGDATQFVDATPEQCAGVAYQSFTELELETPQK
jgi:hypothetical protein